MDLYPPTPDDLHRLAEQLVVAGRLCEAAGITRPLDGSVEDLDAIQAVLDAGRLTPEHTWELQCLGVAFGSVLAGGYEGLDWAIIDDEYGRDPTLRYRDTSVVLTVLTMISKRVEDGEAVRVRELYEGLSRELPRILAEAVGN